MVESPKKEPTPSTSIVTCWPGPGVCGETVYCSGSMPPTVVCACAAPASKSRQRIKIGLSCLRFCIIVACLRRQVIRSLLGRYVAIDVRRFELDVCALGLVFLRPVACLRSQVVCCLWLWCRARLGHSARRRAPCRERIAGSCHTYRSSSGFSHHCHHAAPLLPHLFKRAQKHQREPHRQSIYARDNTADKNWDD